MESYLYDIEPMAFSKKTEFGPKDQRIADYAKALAHPARVAILRTLAKKGACVCGEIVEVMPLAQSTVSQHLRELRDLDLIRGEVDGPKSSYCINWETVRELQAHLEAMFRGLEKWNPKPNCC